MINKDYLKTCDKIWSKKYKKLYHYYETNGNIDLDIEDGELGTFVHAQRKLYLSGKLSHEKTVLLEDLGIEWDVLKSQAYNLLYQIQDYYVENKSLKNMNDELDSKYKRLVSISEHKGYSDIITSLKAMGDE